MLEGSEGVAGHVTQRPSHREVLDRVKRKADRESIDVDRIYFTEVPQSSFKTILEVYRERIMDRIATHFSYLPKKHTHNLKRD
jgi:hypothetical protein